MDIAEGLALARDRVYAAAARSGRRGEDVLIIGASKMNDAGRVREAIAAGLRCCGENRVQEMLEKSAQGAYDGADLHFIGRLQKNKVKNVVGLCSLVHGVDRLELMDCVSRIASGRGLVQDILLEVNIAGEASKTGFSPQALPAALEYVSTLPGLRLRGLMAIPPECRLAEDNIPYFRAMEQLFVDNGSKKYDNVRMDFLSMGMSGDYEAAVSCGANMVRLGTAIFGPRAYPAKS